MHPTHGMDSKTSSEGLGSGTSCAGPPPSWYTELRADVSENSPDWQIASLKARWPHSLAGLGPRNGLQHWYRVSGSVPKSSTEYRPGGQSIYKLEIELISRRYKDTLDIIIFVTDSMEACGTTVRLGLAPALDLIPGRISYIRLRHLR